MAALTRPVKVSTKGQIVIPHAVRERLGIKAGDRLVIVAGEQEAVLMTASRYAKSLKGLARGIYGRTREEIDAYVKGERRTWRT